MRAKPKQKVFVFSIDFDGCISPDSDSRDLKIAQLMDTMAEKLRADPDATLIFLNGSYRQTFEIDQYNFSRNRNGSCFQGLERLLDSFVKKFPDLKDRVSLDRFILEDIQNKKESGYHFNQAIEFLNKQGEFNYLCAKTNTKTDLSSWHDPEKRAQVYAQMQHVACQFPEATIFFEQIDDLYEKILVPCNKFYSENPFFIPENITYTQSQWIHGVPQPNTTEKIKGAGWIDFDYRLNAKLISSTPPEINIESAARLRKWKIVEWFVNQNPPHKSHYAYALYQAVYYKETSLAEKLISQMTPEMRVAHTEGNNRTVLQHAVLQQNYNLLEKLLSDVTEVSEKFEGACENAFNYAKTRGDQRAMELLSPHFIHDDVPDEASARSFSM